MAALAAPLLEPAFPCGPIFHPVGPSVDGRDLYRQAVYRTLQDAIASGNAGAYRLARRKPADWDRAIDTKWAVMPSIVRRRWDAESRRTWPRAGEDIAVRVDPADVFCSLDEVYEVRRRPRRRRGRGQKREPRWDWTESRSSSVLCPIPS
ncbi:hypothetical protein UCRNP2_5404 [Neofusicoccum parvum UCRNP2]|uniref:Uncharacterized protein n=1 Tax=Botryosphaeria parva (strain UCR-NP2) TaxID=1287680 RepID=R1GPE4_BOTPV|nr:hypothetical protein UCRNP2_5404 [Neofusicoccum parvum UCRNP2]